MERTTLEQAHAAAPMRVRQLSLSRSHLTVTLALCTTTVAAAGALVSIARIVLGDASLYGLGPLFELDGESNVPSWFSSMLLSMAALLLALIAAGQWKDRHWREGTYGWALLAVGFLFLSMDEAAQIHERIANVALAHLSIFSRPTFHWVLFGAPAALLAGIAFLPFLRRLPSPVARGFLLAGGIYVAASVGLETLTGLLRNEGLAPGTVAYAALVFCEETSEMVAIAIFIHTLLTCWRDTLGDLNVRIR